MVTAVAAVHDPIVGVRRKRLGVTAWLAIAWLVLMAFFAIFGTHLGIDTSTHLELKRQPPGYDGHILGGDSSGRDLLGQIILGTRASMIVSFGSIAFGTIVGGVLGLIAGYFKGRITGALGSLFDILLAFPPVVLALFLVSVIANAANDVSPVKRELALMLGIGIVAIPILARITRASTLVWSEREFVTAARAMGAKRWRILFREVFPNVLPALATFALLGVAVAIVAESALSILGVGVIGNSWGNTLNSGQADLARGVPHIVLSIVGFLFVTIIALNHLGDVIRARYDVKEAAI
jgi:peptide/nickel transport system permease protein